MYFLLTILHVIYDQKAYEKKQSQDKQTLPELSSALCHLQAKCQLVQTS